MTTLTVSIPTYNRCNYLKEAIESVLAQTYKNYRLLITDNGSKDGTFELVNAYADRDPRIIYHRFPTNQGVTVNWLYALTTPDTELVAFLHDDDIWMPEHLLNAIKAMQEVPDASLYCCSTEAFGDLTDSCFNKRYFPMWLAEQKARTVYDARKNFAPLLMGTPMAASSIVFRRRLINGVCMAMDDTFGALDYFLWAQLALQGPMLYEPEVYVRYRWHRNNGTLRSMGIRRTAAQYRYTLRYLALMALDKKALDFDKLLKEASSCPIVPLANLVVAFAVFDAPAYLRRVALQIFERRRHDVEFYQVSRHYRLASRLGGIVGRWYLSVADWMDRAYSGWWKPNNLIKFKETGPSPN